MITYHEVTLDKVELVRKALLGGIMRRTFDLIVVVVQAGDMASGELGDLTGGATNTAPDVEHPHTLLDANRVREVVLVAGNGLVERLAVGEAAEVEGLAPSILVEVGREVVVATGSVSVPDVSGQ